MPPINFKTVGGATVTVTSRLFLPGHSWNCAGCKTRKRPRHHGNPSRYNHATGKYDPRTRDEATTEANAHAGDCRATPRR